jgi:hypothetical protein
VQKENQSGLNHEIHELHESIRAPDSDPAGELCDLPVANADLEIGAPATVSVMAM